MSLSQAEIERDEMCTDLCTTMHTMKDHEILYFNWIGHNEHGCTTIEELRGVLQDYIREFCHSTGIQCPTFE